MIMGLFTFEHSEQYSELEKALQGVPFSGEVRFSYSGRKGEKDKETASPVYLLPVDAHNKVIYGYFIIDGKLAEVPLGFSRKNNFLSVEHFRLHLNGEVIKENESCKGVLHLPLKLTDLVLDVGAKKEGQWVNWDGSPFSVFGVNGSQGIYPLIFVSDAEEGIMCKGLYKTKDRQLASYDHQGMRPSDEKVKKILEALRGVKPIVQGKKFIDETVQVGSGKSPEPAKSLETLANGEINWEEPKSIVAYLGSYVVGQEDAKMIIAIAFSNYIPTLTVC